eukprot:6594525-Alexandrium_andersonii.AAC.1
MLSPIPWGPPDESVHKRQQHAAREHGLGNPELDPPPPGYRWHACREGRREEGRDGRGGPRKRCGE